MKQQKNRDMDDPMHDMTARDAGAGLFDNIGKPEDIPSSPSGSRALANLLLMEHDLRRARTASEVASIMATRLDGFTHCEGVVVWIRKGRGHETVISRFKEGRLTVMRDKDLEKWASKLTTWLSKSDMPCVALNLESMPPRVFDLWPEIFSPEGLHVPMTCPAGGRAGGALLLRSQAWSEAGKIMLQQLGEEAGYHLKAQELGIFSKTASNLPRLWLLGTLALVLVASVLVLTVADILPVPDFLKAAVASLRDLVGSGNGAGL